MGTKLYVGNLPYSVDKDRLEQIFGEFGTVASAQVIMDRETGRSKGFGFVEMGSDQGAQDAIAALNGKSFEGRSMTVNEARPQEPRSGFGGPRRGPGGGSGGGGRRGPGGGSGGGFGGGGRY
ncbi:RNA-binding protein [Zoogloea sp.]|uniref:RNA recognition motif domain-containing protein n=1 Tax=Zoogloea sp. TaxID=49181 RepID=UPI0026313324|nr:RNA-binding protein [Zoogloea sp.]MDD3352863.1 RNA-binding protein [Zoogloea sp.]